MLAPQSIDPEDQLMVFEGRNVVEDNTSGNEVDGIANPTLTVNINLLDMTDGTNQVSTSKIMTYIPEVDYWSVNIVDMPTLTIGHKYVGKVSETTPTIMREFSILEFSVDDKALEKTLMTQEYIMTFSPGVATMTWKNGSGVGTYKANLFKDAAGTIPATSPADVVVRSSVIKL